MHTKRRRAKLVALLATVIGLVMTVVPGSIAEAGPNNPGPNEPSPYGDLVASCGSYNATYGINPIGPNEQLLYGVQFDVFEGIISMHFNTLTEPGQSGQHSNSFPEDSGDVWVRLFANGELQDEVTVPTDCEEDIVPLPPVVNNAECGPLGTLPNGTEYATDFTAVAFEGGVTKYPFFVDGVPTALIAEPGVPVGVPPGAEVSPWAEDLQGNLLVLFDPIVGAPITPCEEPTLDVTHTKSCGSIELTFNNNTPWGYAFEHRVFDTVPTAEPYYPDNERYIVTNVPAGESRSVLVNFSEDDPNGWVEWRVRLGPESDLFVPDWQRISTETDCLPNEYTVTPKKIWVNEVPEGSLAMVTYSFSDERDPVTVTFNADGDIVDGPAEFVLPIGVSITDVTEEYDLPDGWSCEMSEEAPATELAAQGGRQGNYLKVYNDCEETPKPDPKVEYGEWTDGDWACDDTTVTQTRTRTTTPFIWVDGDWVLDTDNATTVTETRTRDLTAEEQFPCEDPRPEQPEPKVRTVVDEQLSCENRNVTMTTTKFETPAVWDEEAQTWTDGVERQLGDPIVEVRAATDAELEDCPKQNTGGKLPRTGVDTVTLLGLALVLACVGTIFHRFEKKRRLA